MQDYEDYVNNLKRKITVNKKEILFVCIGDNKIIWDSIGPLVGTYLKKKIGKTKVLGDIKNNICSEDDLNFYYPKLTNKFIIAIDSAISDRNLEGQIFVNKTPIIMGLGINRNKGIIGDVSIKASISNMGEIDEKYVRKFSKTIGKGLYQWYVD